MKIELLDVAALCPYEKNARVGDVDAVAAVIKEVGFRQPIVVDGDCVIIVGHTRWRAAQKLGLKKVPVHIARDLTPEQARKYRIADNQTGDLAEWNWEQLSAELGELKAADVDLSTLGFEADELAKLLGEQLEDEALDEAPPVPKSTRSKRGDVWILGEHRLRCGDAADRRDVESAVAGKTPQCYLIDPPYNIGYVGKTEDALTIANDDMPSREYLQFLKATLAAGAALLAKGGAFYIFHADTETANVRAAAAAVGLPFRQNLIWAKKTFAFGRADYHWQHEPCLYGWKDGVKHAWYGDRAQGTLLEYAPPRANDVHPTMKPVEMLCALIRNSTQPGDLVLDNFGGSGSTLIACEKTKRRAAIVELDPKYCDVIVERWEKFTGKKARRVPAAPDVVKKSPPRRSAKKRKARA